MNSIEELEGESTSIGRIDIQDLNTNPDLIKEKLNEKIQSILDKYGYSLSISEFRWVNGEVQANIELVKNTVDDS